MSLDTEHCTDTIEIQRDYSLRVKPERSEKQKLNDIACSERMKKYHAEKKLLQELKSEEDKNQEKKNKKEKKISERYPSVRAKSKNNNNELVVN